MRSFAINAAYSVMRVALSRSTPTCSPVTTSTVRLSIRESVAFTSPPVPLNSVIASPSRRRNTRTCCATRASSSNVAFGSIGVSRKKRGITFDSQIATTISTRRSALLRASCAPLQAAIHCAHSTTPRARLALLSAASSCLFRHSRQASAR